MKALKVLRSRLYEQTRQLEEARRNKLRSDQVGTGASAEKIRTYNFPQSRVTDHRINLSMFGMERMLTGELLNEFIQELLKNDIRVQLHNL